VIDPPAAATPAATRTATDIIARVITETCHPVYTASATLIGVGAILQPGWHGILLGAAAAVLACMLPLAAVLIMVKRGCVTDHHVQIRSQRTCPFAIGITGTACGVAALIALGAPRQLLAVTITMLISAAVALLISLKWKASIHVAVACAGTITMAVIADPRWLYALPCAAVIAWSRVRVDHHTPRQTLGGATFGTLITLTTLPPLLHALAH
jgi:hypothetical protein